MIEYNDNELLYLINEGSEIAQDILFNKYAGLIKKRISLFKIKTRYRDDFYQEGMMTLNHAILTYTEYYEKTFNKYFDMLLQRHYVSLLLRDVNYFYNVVLVEDSPTLMALLKEEDEVKYENTDYTLNNTLDDKIFKMYLDGYKPKEMSKTLGIDVKKIYNRLFIIKKTLRNSID